ncbi:MAG: OmpA family protein [Dysgonamonadaceae bacterium]|nr:OmpA family protein [Dysgonamonadaceae bacterium]
MKRGINFFLSVLILLSACKSAKLSDAVEKEERGEYYAASQIYRKVYSKTSSKKKYLRGSIAFHLAECYRLTGNTQQALGAYSNAIRYQYEDSSAIFKSAQLLHKLGRYADAKKKYAEFLDSVPDHLLSKNGIEGCDSALVWKASPTKYSVKKEDKFNSRYSEFSPILIGEKFDQMVFTSSRKDTAAYTKSDVTGFRNNDFYTVKQDEKGQWLKPEKIESEINTEFDEGAGSITPDGSAMYYTYCAEEDGLPRTADIYKSSRSDAKWSAGHKVEIFKDTLSLAAHPAVGVDGYLYFVSDVKGGYGGKDIWRVPLDKVGQTAPENLGPQINTAGDEMFPYMRSDSVLYFSSDGLPGMGGLDIFKATYSDSLGWKAENMKSPINSAGDDFGIVFEGIAEKGFFSSNRNDSRGADHIFSFVYPPVYVYIEGWVLDRDEELIDNAAVRMVGKDGSNQRFIVRADGTYTAELVRGMDYVLMGSAPGYLNQKQTLSVPHSEKSDIFYVDFYLPSISKPVLIENIFYAFNKADLRPESKEALDELVAMMDDNPNITIELSAHTDRIGSDEYNQDLSLRRAQSVVNYLIASGISKDRMTPAGYGKTMPKTVTKNIAEKYDFLKENQVLSPQFISTLQPKEQEIADQINRRTEFMVLRTDYGLR